jgi:hypothetical protein
MSGWTSNGDGTSSFETSFGTIVLPDDRLNNSYVGNDIGSITTTDPGYHEYSVSTRLGIAVGQIPLSEIQAVLARYPTPYGSYFAGPGFVTHYSPDGNTIVNITTDIHILEPGAVQRQIVVIDGQYHIITFGMGTGFFPGLNESAFLGEVVWGAADKQIVGELIAYALRNNLPVPTGAVTTAAECFLSGTPILLADESAKAIESIIPGDLVLSYDSSGTLVPSRVTRTFRNEVSHLLDVHGLKVTPGHATLCGEGMFKGRHVPIIDILLSDGALVQADGTLVRMAINAPVGSVADALVKLSVAATPEDMQSDTLAEAEMRAGTLLFDRDGVPISVLDCLTAEGYAFDPETGLVAKPGEAPHRLFWFGRLPRPEDYILTRSQETLEGILTDGEWEGSRSELIAGRLRQTRTMRVN